jgi:dephospho-CoA kinase
MGRILGLTGGIGSGKSTVAALLKELGAQVVDADRVAHGIYEQGKPGYDLLVDRFGQSVLGEDGEVDRRLLGEIVFNDREALNDLNDIVHPLVRAEVSLLTDAAMDASPVDTVVVEAALMSETGWTGGAGVLWTVIANPEIVRARLLEGRGMSAEEAQLRMAAQLDNDVRRKGASVLIENDGTADELRDLVEELWFALLAPS